MEIIQIVAVTETEQGLGIGFEGDLPWHVPEDLKHFKAMTEGYPVLMGRKTFESLPFENGLPNRINLVLSRNDTIEQSGSVYVDDNINCLLDITRIYQGMDKVFIIGGAEIYNLTESYTDTKIVTTIQGDYKCDTFLDDSFLKGDFKKVGKSVPLRLGVSVNTYKRK